MMRLKLAALVMAIIGMLVVASFVMPWSELADWIAVGGPL
jgi:hypothetical protein